MRKLAPFSGRLGSRGFFLIVMAPFVAGVLTALATMFLVKPPIQASAEVDIQPVIGTRAAFEISSYTADFVNSLSQPVAQEDAAEASGMPVAEVAGSLTAESTSGQAGAQVKFVASDADSATSGLRAATRAALVQVGDGDRRRAQLEFDAAKSSLAKLLRDLDQGTLARGSSSLQPEDLATARQQALLKGADRVESTQAALVTAQNAVQAVDSVVEGLHVRTEATSITSDRIRLVVLAALAAFLVAVVSVVAVSRRRAAQLPSGWVRQR